MKKVFLAVAIAAALPAAASAAQPPFAGSFTAEPASKTAAPAAAQAGTAPTPAGTLLFGPEDDAAKPKAEPKQKQHARPSARKPNKKAVQAPNPVIPAPVAAEATAGQPVAIERDIPTAALMKAKAPVPISDRVRIEASNRWEREGVADALVGTGGQVEYAYGQSRPTITCAPLHVCTVQFIAGETITSMSVGDTVRWLAQSTTAGDRPVVVVKPTQAGISTNLVVTTDAGRVYYMHLVASKEEYIPMVGFFDPAALVTDMKAQAAQAAAVKAAVEAAKAKAVVADVGKGVDPAKLDFGYACKADEGAEDLKPVRVFASATHTYLQMSPEMKAGDAPAVFNVSTGETELMNSRLNNGYYIVDGKPAKIKLVVGVSDKARTVECGKASQSQGVASFWR